MTSQAEPHGAPRPPAGSFGAVAAEIVAFRSGTRRFGLPVMAVERVVPAVTIAPMRAGLRILLGVIDFHGEIIPVLDLSRRFGLRGAALSHHARFILARFSAPGGGERRIALVADEILGVRLVDASPGSGDASLIPGMGVGGTGMPRGVSITQEGLIYIYDGAALLSPDEERRLTAALPRRDA